MVESIDYDSFITTHGPQLKSSALPEIFWPTLYRKLIVRDYTAKCLQVNEDNLESDNWFDRLNVTCKAADGLNPNVCEDIFLIEHVFTFRTKDLPVLLREPSNNSRLQRLYRLNEVNDLENYVWKSCFTYNFANKEKDEDQLPWWYIMSEFGTFTTHSLKPNIRTFPFYFVPENLIVSVMFPVEKIESGERLTRNYIEGCRLNYDEISLFYVDEKLKNNQSALEDLMIKALLHPWFKNDFDWLEKDQICPDDEYFNSRRQTESRPARVVEDPLQVEPRDKLKVYTDYQFIRENLTSDLFELEESAEDADIWWIGEHYKMWRELSIYNPTKFINQYPFEHIITVKDLLALLVRKRKIFPHWLALTFDLENELPKMIAKFEDNKKNELGNVWIIKPWNMARGIDTVITDNIDCIIRARLTGPKIACKYVENPLLFYRHDLGCRVKFDVRYIILLRSVLPLRIFAFKHFWLRFANIEYELGNYDEYERHFTVMNYGEKKNGEKLDLMNMLSKDFIDEFHRQYPAFRWFQVETRIFKAISQVFNLATTERPPAGIQHNPQSRAIYAVDLILNEIPNLDDSDADDTVIEPVLFEFNYMPDCTRACQQYPTFINDVFDCLFFDKISDNIIEV